MTDATRPRSPRRRAGRPLAVTALAAAVLGPLGTAGCSSDEPTASSSSTSSTSSPSTSGASAPASSSASGSSSATASSGTASSAASPTTATGPALSSQLAARVAGDVLAAAAQSQRGNGTAAADARGVAFTGTALRAAVGDARLAAVAPQLRLGPPAITGSRPGILAISRVATYPHALLAQTRPGGSLYPVLYLMTSPRPRAGYRITTWATLLPSARIRAFAPLTAGAPVLTGGSGLTTSVGTLLSAYAKGLSYPAAKHTGSLPYRAGDRFAAQVRQHAAAQASGVKVQAAFTQKHAVVPGSTTTVGQADGGALVFTTFERTDSFAVRPTQRLVPSATLKALQPKLKTVTKKATLTTLELLVFEVPARGSSDTARLVAASEHLVSGSGS